MIPGAGPNEEADKRLDTKKKGLGRGLSALFGDSERFYAEESTAAPAPAAGRPLTVPIEWLRPSKAQPRTRFRQFALAQQHYRGSLERQQIKAQQADGVLRHLAQG